MTEREELAELVEELHAEIKELKEAAKQAENFRRGTQRIATENMHGIDSSAVFLGLISENIEEDPIPCFQWGYAILAGKPIALLVPEGVEIPGHLSKVAFFTGSYVKGDDESMQMAINEMQVALEEHLG